MEGLCQQVFLSTLCWHFLGGALAFLAVMIQIETGEKARAEEQILRVKAVATAMLFEIDNFYMRYLKDRSALFESWKRIESDPKSVEVFRAVIGERFAVYNASAHILGRLDSTTARGVVVCYGALISQVELARCYERASDRNRLENTPDGDAEILELRRQLKVNADQAVKLACAVCRRLGQLSGTDFSALTIATEACASDGVVSEATVGSQSAGQESV